MPETSNYQMMHQDSISDKTIQELTWITVKQCGDANVGGVQQKKSKNDFKIGKSRRLTSTNTERLAERQKKRQLSNKCPIGNKAEFH